MVDAKTILIVAGLAFLIWWAGGVSIPTATPAAAQPGYGAGPGCYAAVNAQMRGAWAALDMGTRAGLAMEAIGLCEAQP